MTAPCLGEQHLVDADGSDEGRTIEFLCDADEEDAWRVARSFAARPNDANRAQSFMLLEEKLANWKSRSSGLVALILETIGEYRLESGREYLVKFVAIEGDIPDSVGVRSAAAFSLAALGGDDAHEYLIRLAGAGTSELRATAALSLGMLNDRGAVPTLNTLAADRDGYVRGAAVSALARFCDQSSKSTVAGALSSANPELRDSATWWLAECGERGDEAVLDRMTRDREEMVRWHALKGLMRLGSNAACHRIETLVEDQSSMVRSAAKEYREYCSGHR